jgi:hypothetical protein
MLHAFYMTLLLRIPSRNGYRRREASENTLRRANENLEKRVCRISKKKIDLEIRPRELGRSNEDLQSFADVALLT